MNLKGLVSQRNICFATRPMGDHVAQNMFEQDSHSVPTNLLVAQLSRSADTFAVICFSRSFFCVAGKSGSVSDTVKNSWSASVSDQSVWSARVRGELKRSGQNRTRTLSPSFPDQPTHLL